MTAGRCPILIPAAGSSKRMGGRDKLLEPVGGQALLHRVAEEALATGQPVIVTLPAGDQARRAASDRLPVQVVDVTDAATGMAASFRAYLAAAGDDAPVLILPADMPDLLRADLEHMLAAFFAHGAKRPVRGASDDGRAGHPVVLPAALVARFGELTGDQGAAPLLAGQDVALVPLPGSRAVTDLDTPEDWAAWRELQG